MMSNKSLVALLVACLGGAVSCVSPASKSCGKGLVCPEGSTCAAKQDVCIKDSCGNGVKDPNEVCDDGNVMDGDGCSHDCKSNETCGNGYPDSVTGEVCDDGNNTDGDGCSADCKSREGCGNGELDISKGEVCDDGNNTDGDGCSADCRSNETCGNGRTDSSKGEVCDDGNNLSGDGCSADCKSNETCGNHIIDIAKGEVCDDGNNTDLDGCSANCKSDESCGNGYLDTPKGEICDDHNNADGDGCAADCSSEEKCGNGVRDVGEQCDTGTESATCNSNCTFARCGDLIINTKAGEDCDDGKQTASCNADCTAPVCGDGKVNSAANEQCDNVGAVDSADCNKDCTVAFCGDKKINPARDEQCDDGKQTDTCNADCTSRECGDGKINTSAGEQCDTKGGADTDTCNGKTGLPAIKRCQLAKCGDGYPNMAANEECDDAGNSIDCNADCTLSVCGDGKVNAADDEECDDGNNNDHDGCVGCKLAKCGDGTVWYGHERCDDGNQTDDGNGCSADCLTSTKCGDGATDNAIGEVCDDGNNTSGDGCSADCLSNESCGNRYVDWAKAEKCDDGNATDDSNGCSADCKTSTKCGNGVLDTNLGEICDDHNTGSGDGCSGDCLSNETCGNAYIDGAKNETCDDGNAFDSDKCPSTCRVAFCGDGFIGSSLVPIEECDDKNGSNTDDCTNQCKNAFCGDGFIHAGSAEDCDDGNGNSGDGCTGCKVDTGYACMTLPSGASSCGPTCGDGLKKGTEGCDDHNALSCGTCNALCSVPQVKDFAVGSITAVGGQALKDGETFTISDGVRTIVFEFDVSATGIYNGVGAGHTQLKASSANGSPGDSDHEMAVKIAAAINNVGALDITATAPGGSGTVVTLKADIEGAFMNIPLAETVLDAGFVIDGMKNGVAVDCTPGTGCNGGDDCRSGICFMNVCQPPSCSDSRKNGTETGQDCGGSCSPCANGLGCSTGVDCQSGLCSAQGICGITNLLTVVSVASGTVTSDLAGVGAGINCGSTCTDRYQPTDTVTLTAAPNSGFVFDHWEGAPCNNSTDPDCAVTMASAFTLTPHYTAVRNINVNPEPTNGKVTGTGIDCGSGTTHDCTTTRNNGLSYSMTAAADTDYEFVKWVGGPCDGSTSTTCSFTVSGDVTTEALFAHLPDLWTPPPQDMAAIDM